MFFIRYSSLYIQTRDLFMLAWLMIIIYLFWVEVVAEVFDLRPKAIIRQLDLLRPIYRKTAAYGHFGRELAEFTWERTDRVDDLRAAAGV